MNPTVSICTVTMDRYDLAVACVGPALSRAQIDYEFLTWDNASWDQRVPEYMASLNPAFQHIHTENIGYAKAVNQLMLKAKGRYICVMDPDLDLPEGWLRAMVTAGDAIPDAGVIGIHCILDLPPETAENGVRVHFGDVFGVKMWRRSLLDKVGWLVETFGLYGLEDRDFLARVNTLGFRSFYVAGLKSVHAGEDSLEQTPYRQHKWDSLHIAYQAHLKQNEYYGRTQNYVVPPPEGMV